MNCSPCYDRIKRLSPAKHVVMGTPMCDRCFKGDAIGNESKVLEAYLKEQSEKFQRDVRREANRWSEST